MKICYEEVRPWPRTLAKYRMVNEVLDDIFVKQGYRLTVRQLFYQLAARGLLANTGKNYNDLVLAVSQGRWRGFIDWDAIEDRLREVIVPSAFSGVSDLLAVAQLWYRLDRQEGQARRIEIWAEKDAVSQIIEPTAREYGIPFLVGRGQFSISCVKEATERWEGDGRPVVILYFGDHDPSGILSIEKNVREKTARMVPDLDIQVVRVAVPERSRILEHLPTNPVKEKDQCAPEYRRRYGERCWELEALSPAQLKGFLEKALKKWMDFDVYREVLEQEEEDRKRLAAIIRREGRRK